MGGHKSKRPDPSHKKGKLRDPKIHTLRDAAFQPEHLHAIIKKAATMPDKKR
jgi:hypothetical protein